MPISHSRMERIATVSFFPLGQKNDSRAEQFPGAKLGTS